MSQGGDTNGWSVVLVVSGQECEVEEIGPHIGCQGESKHGQCRMEALGECTSYL